MNIDIMCTQALVLLIMTACHMPCPQLSIDWGNALYMMVGKGMKWSPHIIEKGKPILCIFQYTRKVAFAS